MFALKNPAKQKGYQSDRQLVLIAVSAIYPNPHQPRREFDEYKLSGLAESIRQNGILQPLTVRQGENNQYELIAGERRLRASKMAGLQMVPCIICKIDEQNSALFSLLENLQREDLTMFEEADGIAKLIDQFSITQQEAAEQLGMAQSTLANKLRLLKLTPDQRSRIMSSRLTERHSRAVVRLPDEVSRDDALDIIIARQLNVSDTEKLIEELLEPKETGQILVRRRVPLIRDVRLFVNTITKCVSTMRQSGLDAKASKNETDDYIEYTVIIPKKAGGKQVG